MAIWVTMRQTPRRGAAGHARLLNCLAPFFYAPRMVGEIDLGLGGKKQTQVCFPLGKENWRLLREETRRRLFGKLRRFMGKENRGPVAADARLRTEFSGYPDMVWGDSFRTALLAVLAEAYLMRHTARRLILAADPFPQLAEFLEYSSRLDVPIMVQNLHPGRVEPLCWRLLHEKGIAVSCGRLRPELWKAGDLILSFRQEMQGLLHQKRLAGLVLSDEGKGFAPELEERVAAAGLDGTLAVLSPLLESRLLEGTDGRGNVAAMIEQGKKYDLWGAFLDKDKAGFI